MSNASHSVSLRYQDTLADLLIRRESLLDVKDINDDLDNHLEEEHQLSLNVSLTGDQAGFYLSTLALAVAVLQTQGFCYIEGDGAYLKPADTRAQIDALRAALN